MSSGTGLRDWTIQRLTAVYMLFFIAGAVYYFATHPELNHAQWSQFIGQAWVQITLLLAFLSVAFHAWVGVWTIATDYIKSTALRLGFLILVLGLLFGYFAWGVLIIWG